MLCAVSLRLRGVALMRWRAGDAAVVALTHAALPRCAAGLSLMEQDILKDWKAKFDTKYTKVGTVKR